MSSTAITSDIRIVRIREVMALTGLSRSGIYLAIKQGSFPAQIKLSVRSSGWFLSEVINWVNTRPRGGTTPEQ